MILGYAQTATRFGDKEFNFNQAAELLKDVKADLIVLPELFATGYTFVSREEAAGLAEELDGPTLLFLKGLAKKTGGALTAGFVEKEGTKIYNSQALVSERGVIGVYRKLHLFNREKLLFTPGNLPLKVYSVKGVKIGMMICFDWIFPETARTLALLGAEVIAHGTNLVLPYCQKAMVTRCLENRVFAVTANRIGREKRGGDDFTFTGASQITAFNGEVLSSAPENRVFVDTVEIEVERAGNKRINEFNDLLADRRKEFYFNT